MGKLYNIATGKQAKPTEEQKRKAVIRLEIIVELDHEARNGGIIERTDLPVQYYDIRVIVASKYQRTRCPNQDYFNGPGKDISLPDKRDVLCRECADYMCERGEIIEIGRLSGRLKSK